jgi:hypothetical protein
MKVLPGIISLLALGALLGATPAHAFSAATIICESARDRYQECRTPFQSRAVLLEQFSTAHCIEGRSWGWEPGRVWVDLGCSARFGAADAAAHRVFCESRRGRLTVCETGWHDVRLVEQTSRERCREGESFGVNRRGELWVDRNCAGWFEHVAAPVPQPPATPTEIACESHRGREQRCPTPGWRGAELVRQTSRAQCVEDRSWGFRRGEIWVSRDCAGLFREARRVSPPLPEPPPAQVQPPPNTVPCESRDGRTQQCRIPDTWRQVALVLQTSSAPCIQDQTWGLRRGQVWVSAGCGGYFGVADALSVPGLQRENVLCESRDGRRHVCRHDMTNVIVALLRRLSDAPCLPQQTWGWDQEGIWVDKGCRAEFQLQRRTP